MSMTHRRKLRPLLWPVSRNVIIACAGLCGVTLAPHMAFADSASSLNSPMSSGGLDANSEVLVAMGSGRYRLADDITGAPLNSSLCVDLQQLFGALDFPITVDRSRQVASGWFIEEDQSFSLDLKTGAASVGTKKISVSPQSIGNLSSGSCVTIDALAPLLGLTIDYQASGSFLGVTSVRPLPILERLKRQDRTVAGFEEASAQTVAPRVRSLPYRAFVAPNADVSVTFNRVKSERAALRTNATWSILSIGELAYMTAEAQLGGTQAGLNGEVSRFRLYRSEADGGVFGFAKLTDFSVGDISAFGSSLGGNGGSGFGISASTFPLNRPTSFDRTTFEGDLPAGWDVELYRNGQLLEFRNDGTTGGYSFKDIPVLFGENNFEIVQYGPQGQRRVINRSVNASNFLAPKGDSYYRAAVYRPEILFGRKRVGSGVRIDFRAAVGIADNFNLAGGFDSYMLAGTRLSIGTLSALTSVSGIALNAELVGTSEGKFAGQIELQGQGRGASLRARLVVAQDGFRTEKWARSIVGRFDASADRSFRLPNSVGGSLSGRVVVDRLSTNETIFSARQRLTLAYGNSSIAQSLTWSHSPSGERRDQIDGDVAYSFRRGYMSFRTSAAYSLNPTPKLNRLSAAVERPLGVNGDAWRWRAETSWDKNDRTFIHNVGIGREFGLLNLDIGAETDGRKSHAINLSLSFALGRRQNGWGMTSKPLASTGTVRARIFEDNDDNGVFSNGDVPMERVGLVGNSGRGGSMTNASGYAVLDGVVPNLPTLVNVITDDLEDQNLFARPTYTKAREGTVSDISIPLTVMGSIEGTIDMVAGFDPVGRPLGGVELVLLNGEQKEVARTSSAYDGYYSFDRVPVGTYTVALASDTSLARRFRPVETLQVATSRAQPGVQGTAMTLIESNPTSTKMALRGLL
jgi:hypothetical protein